MAPIAKAHRVTRSAAAFAATLAAGGLIAACSSSSGGGGSSSNGKTTITLSMQQTDVKTGDPTTWALVQAFEKKYPNITVTVTGQPVATHNQDIEVAAQSHTLPTIFWVESAQVGAELAKDGALLNLTPIMAADGITDIPAATLTEFKEGNIQFGLPYQALLTGLFYNKKILSENGLTLPKTFDQLIHVATVLHAKGITTIADGANQSAYAVWSFLTDLDRFGYDGQIQSILAGQTSYDNPDMLRFYTDLAALQKAGAFSSDVSNQTYNQAVSAFTSGKAAMLDSGVWACGQLQTSSVGADTGFWPGPQFTDGVGNQNIAMNVVGAPIAVSGSVKPGTAEYSAVEKFIGFYYSAAGQQIFASNGQPPVTTYQPTIPASDTVFAATLAAVRGLPTPKNQPDQYLTAAEQNAMYDSIFGVIEGQLTPQAAVTTVSKAITAGA
jgi:raffinose/stachyose/melibiose transport system substrate-binding protein